MTITFSYEELTAIQADKDLWLQVVNFLNSLNKEQRDSVKVASSDIKGNIARTVAIYSQSPAPKPDTLGSTWRYKVFETATDYHKMYRDCINYLNESVELNDTQKYYSKISMTNASEHNSRLVLYYRV